VLPEAFVSDCIFCKIGAGQIPSKMIYQDDELFAFEDLHPQAPTHILICPRQHIDSLGNVEPADAQILGRLLVVAAKLATERNLLSGFRTLFNSGEGAGQSVFHLHLHLLGGRPFRWPPG
jgi:histidine triad (HIT) family protein